MVKKRAFAFLPPLPPSGAFWFFDTIDAAGQNRAKHFMFRAFLAGLAVALPAQFLPGWIGARPLSWIWMFPAVLGGLAVLFWATGRAILLTGHWRGVFQAAVTLFMLVFFVVLFLWQGGSADSAARWTELLVVRSDDRDLVFTAFGLGAVLGWTVHYTYPVRTFIVAMLLIFMAVWMDLQGYYVELHDGYSIFLPGYADVGTTRRTGDLPDNDGGRAIVAMTTVTFASWLPLLVWLAFKRRRAAKRP